MYQFGNGLLKIRIFFLFRYWQKTGKMLCSYHDNVSAFCSAGRKLQNILLEKYTFMLNISIRINNIKNIYVDVSMWEKL